MDHLRCGFYRPWCRRRRRCGVHALVGGSLVSLDGQRSTAVPGVFGQMPDQTAATLSRSGRRVASVVTQRPGAPDMAAALWIGDLGGEAVQSADGHSMSRPSWSLDDAVWVVVDGNNVLRAIQEPASGQPARIPVDSAAVSSRFPVRSASCSCLGTEHVRRWSLRDR
ncbi:lipoLpqB beta-propeller domain protein [Mycobacterium xenopi 4042]|uniref:LipoLpqB beta-propeller domain protein n=1 Tax=Mycobacterium xenopi 4042 TaxID=1299334 RepID=X7YJ00_MYCXE|nr:lipoLpqB beta-propeller domain protein [Mycobacterium xenopi 4042]